MTTLGLLPAGRFEMIYNSVDLSRVAPNPALALEFRRRFGIPLDRVVVVQVSWIIPEKGILDLLKAARAVIAHKPDVQFVFVGEGAYREQYTRDAEALGIGDHVTWTGLIKDPFGEGVYDVADIVCQVSNWEEVFGWVIAEAMAYGKPIVGTRVGGIPELIEESVSGYLVDRGDDGAMAEKILTLAGNADLRKQMGEEGRKIAREKFDLAQAVAQLIECYEI